jgi:peptidoglycan-N-acetylmuramic acid deacetylase
MRKFLKHNARLLLAAAAVTFFCGALSRLFAADTVIETGSWGLSFQQEGQAPVGNATKAALRGYNAVYVGDTADKVIYLTFDAGYENGCTGQILDVLKQHNVKACFFLVGNYLEQNPELVMRMTEEGHTVGNHTWHHYDMSKIADKQTFTQELSSAEEKYREITGKEMSKFYRPPQGVYSEENLKMAKELGYKTVFWSLAYVDWYRDDQPTAEEAFAKLLPRIHPGAIVLLHSTSATNAAILDELLTKWEDMGYRFGTLDELYGAEQSQTEASPAQSSAASA